MWRKEVIAADVELVEAATIIVAIDESVQNAYSFARGAASKRRPRAMARSTDFGTKRIPAGSAGTKEITRSIDERCSRSSRWGRYATTAPHHPRGLPRREPHQIR